MRPLTINDRVYRTSKGSRVWRESRILAGERDILACVPEAQGDAVTVRYVMDFLSLDAHSVDRALSSMIRRGWLNRDDGFEVSASQDLDWGTGTYGSTRSGSFPSGSPSGAFSDLPESNADDSGQAGPEALRALLESHGVTISGEAASMDDLLAEDLEQAVLGEDLTHALEDAESAADFQDLDVSALEEPAVHWEPVEYDDQDMAALLSELSGGHVIPRPPLNVDRAPPPPSPVVVDDDLSAFLSSPDPLVPSGGARARSSAGGRRHHDPVRVPIKISRHATPQDIERQKAAAQRRLDQERESRRRMEEGRARELERRKQGFDVFGRRAKKSKDGDRT